MIACILPVLLALAATALAGQPHETAGWVGANYTPAYCVNQVYVQDVIAAHREDKRVLWWEVFNEPNLRSPVSVKLRKLGYAWAKELKPSRRSERMQTSEVSPDFGSLSALHELGLFRTPAPERR